MTCRFYLIDDDQGTLRVLERIIVDQELGIVAGTAADGIAGEEGVLATRPDIVVIDLLMPRRDGLETLISLRRRGYEGSFVVLSRVTDKGAVERAYQAGVRFFVHKPINLVEIRSVLREVSDSLAMQHALITIRSGLRALYETDGPPSNQPGDPLSPGSPPSGAQSYLSGRKHAQQAVRRILTDLGILGETGADDLLAIAMLPLVRDPARQGSLQLQHLYEELARHYERTGAGESKSIGPKAIEQRLRRAATLALRHLAALGLEDYGDPRFERLAGTFFEFEEVRLEMVRLRRGTGPGGRISLKRFTETFLRLVDDDGA